MGDSSIEAFLGDASARKRGTGGQPCKTCGNREASEACLRLAERMADGKADGVSWEWIAEALKQHLGFCITQNAIKNHMRNHLPDGLWKRVEESGHPIYRPARR